MFEHERIGNGNLETANTGFPLTHTCTYVTKKKIERDARFFKPQSPRDAQGLVTTCTSLQPLAPCKMKFSTSSIKEKLPVLFYFNARKIQNDVSKVIPSPPPSLLITSTRREFRDHLKAKRTLKSKRVGTRDYENNICCTF